MVLIALFSFATDFGISAMTVRAMARDPENETAIQSSAFWVWTAFTIPVALAIVAVSQIVYSSPGDSVTRDAVLILMATFPLVPFSGAASARAIADQRVWLISLASMLARVLGLAAVIGAAALKLGPLGITAAFAVGSVLEQVLVIAVVRPKIEYRVGLHRGRIWSLVAAAVPLGTVLVVNGLYFRLDAFLLSVLGSKNDLAVYGVAYKAFESLLVFPDFVMITLIPVLSSLDFASERFRELVQKAFTSMTILVLPIFGFSVLGGEAMVALAGPKYAEGGLVLAFLMWSVGFACIQGVFGNTLVTQGRQGALLRVSLTVLVVNGIINVIAIPLAGDVGAAAALFCTELISLVLTLRVYGRYAPLPRLHMPGRLLIALGALALGAAVGFLLPNAIAAAVVGVGVGSIAYLVVLVALGALPPYMSGPLESMLRTLRPGGAA
jgi:O-antigen/teichoic acid export membrane protein